ncbi:DUF2254 domain-containing protein [Halocola ammonii]
MKKLRSSIKRVYQKTVKSIAFLPTMISFLFFVFFFTIRAFEDTELSHQLANIAKPLLVSNIADSRLILGSIIGGLISLIVFSFTMVMLVLNTASSTLSPRVLPGLITRKNHQVVLGFYVGSLTYSILLVIKLSEQSVPSWGVFFAMLFMLLSFAFFVYFIHSISVSIQVDKIVESIFKETRKGMHARQKKYSALKSQPSFPETDGWFTLRANLPGYFKNIDKKQLISILQEHDLVAEITVDIGFFTVKNYPFLRVNRDLSNEQELCERIKNCFTFYIEEYVGSHYTFGMKQISEVAVKALSPGINDPGTAVKCTDLLFMLLLEKLSIPEREFEVDENGKLRVMYRSLTLDELLFLNLTPIRQYGQSDSLVMLNLLEGLKNLAYTDQHSKAYTATLTRFSESLIVEMKKTISTDQSRERINRMIGRLNELLDERKLEKI